MEYRKKCNVCGNVFCYSDKDINDNMTNAAMGALSAVGSIASILGGGTIFHTSELNRRTDRYSDKVIDFNKCPRCNSTNLSFLTEEEFAQLQAPAAQTARRIEINSNATTENLLKRAEMFLMDKEWSNADGYADAVLDVDPENALAYVYKLMASLKVSDVEELKQQKKPFDENKHFKKAVRFGDEALAAMLNDAVTHIKERNEEEQNHRVYQLALTKMNAAKTETEYLAAAAQFSEILGYRDAEKLAETCRTKGEEACKDAIYEEACGLLDKSKISDVESAIELFHSISGWKDAEECIELCKEKLKKLNEQAEAERQKRERRAELERQEAKKNKKISAIVIGVLCIIAGIVFVVSEIVIPNQKYNDAVAMMEAGEYAEAYDVFVELGDYKDSVDKAIDLFAQANYEKLKSAKVGDVVFYGRYEQDNDMTNGKENIEWIVLDKQGDKVLLISKYVLDNHPLDKYYSGTWEKCSARNWLNGEFFYNAFNDNERNNICNTSVIPAERSKYYTNPGNTTEDKVFLLSKEEVNKYFDSAEKRECEITTYGGRQQGYAVMGDGDWWLRSFVDKETAVIISSSGFITVFHISNFRGIRPAMWIDLNT